VELSRIRVIGSVLHELYNNFGVGLNQSRTGEGKLRYTDLYIFQSNSNMGCEENTREEGETCV